MFKLRSIVVLALLLAVAQACPYLVREQEKQGNLRDNAKPAQSERQTRKKIKEPLISLKYDWNTPTTVAQAVRIASAQIKQVIEDNLQFGLSAKFVRLAFHDCVGGCDGCVDMRSPSNFGLDLPIDCLEHIVTHNKQFLTTGDVWALAGLVSARLSQMSTGSRFALQYVGRPQCAGNATYGGPPRMLPSAHFTTKQVVHFFKTTFNFSADETVALMGAHSLYVVPHIVPIPCAAVCKLALTSLSSRQILGFGCITSGFADSANSGFSGGVGWDNIPDRLENEYYKELLSFDQLNLHFDDNTAFPPFPNQFYWVDGQSGIFMLHADMALAFDMQGYLNPTNGAVNCTLVPVAGQKQCPPSPLRGRAKLYAHQNARWVKDFEAVLVKMVNTGCGNGVCKPIA